MSSGDTTEILRVSGRLCVGPTNLSQTFPHGGTAIGISRRCALRLRIAQHDVDYEEFDEVGETIRGGQRVVGFSALLRQVADNDVLNAIFPDTSVGASTKRVVNIPGSARAGALGSSVAVKLLFSADLSTDPSIIIYRAIPEIVEEDEVASSVLQEMVWSVRFKAIRDASGRTAKVGRLGDLSV